MLLTGYGGGFTTTSDPQHGQPIERNDVCDIRIPTIEVVLQVPILTTGIGCWANPETPWQSQTH